jgi:3-deoxy-D-manno-octulosonate 8-phosphate phosphatase (KDO 8-P phosphatase)
MNGYIESIFTEIGGVFLVDTEQISLKLKGIKAFVFDWDGVFNNAVKNENKSSNFNEADSMGTNLLRFNYFLDNNKIPACAVISGEKNEMAFYFCEREHFSNSYYKISDKIIALEHFCKVNKIEKHEVCYMFDDVLDLSIAKVCGIRILINRKANPLFKNFVINNNLADYITAHESGNFAVREACEMLIGLTGNYNEVIENRTNFSATYKDYINQRQATSTTIFSIKNNEIFEDKIMKLY